MTDAPIKLAENIPKSTVDYLSTRLDGARDLYLLALSLGSRPDAWRGFGRMIREARIHFEAVIEEARLAGFDTADVQSALSEHDMAHALRPEVLEHIERFLNDRRSLGHARGSTVGGDANGRGSRNPG